MDTNFNRRHGLRKSPFLTAQWRNLVMRNYEVDPELLQPWVPAGTELDFWNGRTFVSLVGFQFLQTRLLGWKIPFHTRFDEVNLRFYVRSRVGNQWKRGVVFLKEIAPRRAVVWVARRVYNEKYVRLPMRSTLDLPSPENGQCGQAGYSWKWAGRWNRVSACFSGQPSSPEAGSEAEFITEHYWGYSAQRDGSTLEYRVDHPPWRIWPAERSWFEGDVATLYGADFGRVLQDSPSSAFVADGSNVAVFPGEPLRLSHPAGKGAARRAPEMMS